jgi:hypothetical protein
VKVVNLKVVQILSQAAAQQLVAADLLIDSLYVAGLGQGWHLVLVAPSFHPQAAELGPLGGIV